MQNIRDKEIQLLSKMLNLSTGSASSTDFNDQWKVLIYDQRGRDIISPLLNVQMLRQKGVTLHLMLHSDREAVPDAPAVYFIAATADNLKRIADDCAKQLYRTVYIHFTTRIERPLLESFAQDLVKTGSQGMISKIFDEYLDVIALESHLFSLNINDAFLAYNEPSLSEAQVRAFMSKTASGLLSAVRVLNAIPIIRAPMGGAAQMLAQELHSQLKDSLSARGSSSSSSSSSSSAVSLFEDCLAHERGRPLLVVLERSSDLFPVLQHNAIYQALAADVLDLQLNRVTVDVPDKTGSGSKRKMFELSASTDVFLQRHASDSFPAAVEASEKELAEVSQRESAIRARPDFQRLAENDPTLTSSNNNNNSNNTQALEGKNKDLSDAIESLPDLLHRKSLLDVHTTVMQNVMKHVAAREIPTFFELEQTLLSGGARAIDKSAVLALLRDGQKGSMQDKARLLALVAVTLLSGERGTDTNMDEYDSAFQSGSAAIGSSAPPSTTTAVVTTPSTQEIEQCLAGVQFLRRLLSLQGSPMSRFGGSSSSSLGLTSLLSSATSHATSLLSKFLAKFTPFYATRVVLSLSEGKGGPEDDTFLTLDPRARDGVSTTSQSQSQSTMKYSDVIVFVLGGGCYAEYFNLQELLSERAAAGGGTLKNVVYGCTDLISGKDFLMQLQKLGASK